MQPNKDQIARPAQGRFFTCTVPEVLKLIGDFGFTHSPYLKRLDVLFKNPYTASEIGKPVASLIPANAIVIYSFGEELNPKLAKASVFAALEQLAIIDRSKPPEHNRRTSVSYPAYLGDMGKLTITRRVRTGTFSKYRSGAKFSHAFKPSAVKSEEKIVCAVELA